MPLDVLGRMRATLMYSMQQITASNEVEDRVVVVAAVERGGRWLSAEDGGNDRALRTVANPERRRRWWILSTDDAACVGGFLVGAATWRERGSAATMEAEVVAGASAEQ